MSYTSFLDSYALEAIYGTSTITAAADPSYLLGVIRERATHPSPRYSAQYSSSAVGAREPAANGISKSDAVYQGNWTIILQNGVPLYLAMGKSVTAGTTHTITPAYIPSITLQSDRKGSGTDWGIQYTGVMCSRFKLMDDRSVPGLIAVLDWVAQDAADPGFVLTSTPALPTTATTGPFYELVTATYDGTDLDGLTGFEFTIDPGLTALMGQWWLAGVDKSHIPIGYVEDFVRKYSLTLRMHPPSDDLWDDGIARSNSKDMVFKWQKSANDYVQITMTDVQILFPETTTPKGDLNEVYECVPTTVSIEVKDAIAAASYGE
jgi:hypothetical protein